MKTYRMTITSCEDRTCRRTVELSERHNLYDLHDVIVDEFNLDDEHLWAFYLSGKFFDSATEYGVSRTARSPEVRLRELGLKRGKKIAYLLDFGSEERHEILVDAIEEASQPLRSPRVVERVGTPPSALEDEDGDWGEGDTFDAEEDSPDFPETLLDRAAGLIDLSDQLMAKATVSGAELAEALKATREVLAACPDRKTLDALGAAVSGELDAELPIVLLELLKKSDADRAEIEALQWTLARLPSGGDEPPTFAPELVAEARWVMNRFEPYGTSALEHFEHVPEEMIARVTRGLLEACPDTERAEEFGEEAAISPASLIAAGVAYLAPNLGEQELEELLQRAEASMGDPSVRVDAAFVLIQADQKARALALIERVDEAALPIEERVELSEALELAGAPERAEQVLRDNLEDPWMEPMDREFVKEALLGLFARAGRTEDAEKLEADERKRTSTRSAAKRGGVVRTGPKVGRNDPCPCGSGKKSKQCCNR